MLEAIEASLIQLNRGLDVRVMKIIIYAYTALSAISYILKISSLLD